MDKEHVPEHELKLDLENPPEQILKLAATYGYMGIFAHRSSLNSAIHFSTGLCSACEDKPAPITALMVSWNTWAIQHAYQLHAVAALREHVRSSLSFHEDKSRSKRRRQAIIDDAKDTLQFAQEMFGDE